MNPNQVLAEIVAGLISAATQDFWPDAKRVLVQTVSRLHGQETATQTNADLEEARSNIRAGTLSNDAVANNLIRQLSSVLPAELTQLEGLQSQLRSAYVVSQPKTEQTAINRGSPFSSIKQATGDITTNKANFAVVVALTVGLILVLVIVLVILDIHGSRNSASGGTSHAGGSIARSNVPDSCPPVTKLAGIVPKASTLQQGLVYKVESGQVTNDKRPQPIPIGQDGSIQQAFRAALPYIISASGIIGVDGDGNQVNAVRISILAANGKVTIGSATTNENQSNNNADVAVTFRKPLRVKIGTVYILKVQILSANKPSIYVNSPKGQIQPSAYTACVTYKQGDKSGQVTYPRWNLAGFVIGAAHG